MTHCRKNCKAGVYTYREKIQQGLRLQDPQYSTEPGMTSRAPTAASLCLQPGHSPVVPTDGYCTSVRQSWIRFAPEEMAPQKKADEKQEGSPGAVSRNGPEDARPRTTAGPGSKNKDKALPGPWIPRPTLEAEVRKLRGSRRAETSGLSEKPLRMSDLTRKRLTPPQGSGGDCAQHAPRALRVRVEPPQPEPRRAPRGVAAVRSQRHPRGVEKLTCKDMLDPKQREKLAHCDIIVPQWGNKGFRAPE
ncbi:nitric oxide synthase-interacting protein-like [Mirounga angustirostris]|uniref:nitric oxide synthase-interacting protein-like n=1 Tax=Mirounga angustirostris TaxID=9716 RepID=UPI001E68F313|nr:nitric oxide synthase-interacting protein-like [Mirounga angustirostris]